MSFSFSALLCIGRNRGSGDGKQIEFFKEKIRKIYPAGDQLKVSFLQTVYRKLQEKGVPNVDRLTRIELAHSEHGCFIELEPRGDARGPESADDVKNAVMCVLEALQVSINMRVLIYINVLCQVSHAEPPLFHRDIRWPNVLRGIVNGNRWFLIDWEDASTVPTKAAPNLRSGTHAPQVFKDGHGAEVDIWAVGKLIRTTQIFELPEDLLSLGRRMVEGSVSSAEQGLKDLKSL